MPYLQFGNPPEHRARWTGPWPPPDRLCVARGNLTGMISVFDPEDTPSSFDIDEVHQVAEVTSWVRYRYSRLPHDTEHVVRGALYIKEE